MVCLPFINMPVIYRCRVEITFAVNTSPDLMMNIYSSKRLVEEAPCRSAYFQQFNTARFFLPPVVMQYVA